ncbi:transcriptional regulator [Vibrio sp. 10N.286.49.B3]|uniref:winged helix-turn-helix domain-containing protein n=1 Tax=Vibrio sp. 10N.286.49.B3 TaxID=1880855 RepID=UPI000C853AA5|nr:transcriptional regulator [Vibrio sp. 10N.286.49.B3]PMH46861.1 transcriptional regulator [Vibrio sp. 10N.286.49.B3]
MSNIGTKFILAQRFVFDPNNNSLVDQTADNEEIIRLGSNESRILLMLSERPNEVITRNELHEFVWRDQGFEVDDSSLTQAISTLRKMLKDSTKSPAFVKTVPKRGYQMIASVERSMPLSSNEAQEDVIEPFSHNEAVILTEKSDDLTNKEEALTAVTSSHIEAKQDLQASWKMTALTFFLCFLSVALPFYVMNSANLAPTVFDEIDIVDGIKVKTPMNHPDLNSWMPRIEDCIQKYNKVHTDELKPIEVIATGGQNNRLVLNYIHSSDYAYENVSVRIYTDPKNRNNICDNL